MKLKLALLAVAPALLCVVAHGNAQATVAMNGIGSSALFLELGQAAAKETQIGASCTWTVGSKTVFVTDTRAGVNLVENGQFFVAWQPGTGTCTAPAGAYNIYSYLQTDSTVGNRCVFAVPACQLTFPATSVGKAGANLLSPVNDVVLPASIQAALNGTRVNTAGTDIRPEDAKFATVRALTNCNAPVNGVAGSQYLGLGYATAQNSHIGIAIAGSTTGGGGSFNVVDFNLTGNDPITTGSAVPAFNVFDVGAVPVVVFVNPSNSNGFGNLLVNNVTRGVLAGYLDGTYGRASDAINSGFTAAGPSAVGVSVFIREPLSGTYNTMEYAIPNNVELQTSQDVGLNQNAAGLDPESPNCNGIVVGQNPLSDVITRNGASSSARYRSIGTGGEVAAVLSHQDSLGYSFWGTGNFKNATAANAKYLTVDGVDPLQQVYVDGVLPTAGNGLLGNVSFANVKNGSYPIWTKLRLASTGGTGAQLLAAAAQNYVSPEQPDFIPINQLLVVRSHFAPPFNASSVYNVNFPSAAGPNTPTNGSQVCISNGPEAGGDVGGLVYTLQADGDFCTDVAPSGQIGRRQ